MASQSCAKFFNLQHLSLHWRATKQKWCWISVTTICKTRLIIANRPCNRQENLCLQLHENPQHKLKPKWQALPRELAQRAPAQRGAEDCAISTLSVNQLSKSFSLSCLQLPRSGNRANFCNRNTLSIHLFSLIHPVSFKYWIKLTLKTGNKKQFLYLSF